MPKRIIDIALINSILCGNTKAFHYIVDEWRDVLYYHILRIVNNKETAEDLTNEVFEKVYNSLSLYKEKYKFSTWMYKIATNTAIDYLRRQKLKPDIQHQLEDVHHLSDNSNPESDIIKSQNYATLQDAISQLKPKYRNIIRMRYFKEMKYEDIANSLQIPIGTVKATLNRAKSKLAQIIINQQK